MEETIVKTNSLTDEELIGAILESGTMDLFGELYDRYGNKVYRKTISMVKDLETAKDLTQEILIKAFLSLAKFEGKSKFSTWLYMVTYNYCIDYIRKQKRINTKEQEYQKSGYQDTYHEDENDEVELLEMEMGRLSELLEKLSTEDKTMLLMYYQDDMSIKDLQEYFDMGASAIKMRLSRARTKIRKLYEETYKNS